MAIDVQRNIASSAPPRKHWWERIFKTRDAPLKARGYFMTGDGNAPALSTSSILSGTNIGIPPGASVVVLTAENAMVRWLVGESPTFGWGNPLPAGTSIVLTLADPDTLNLIAGATGAICHIQCFRVGDT